jgi:uncharacterized protein YkwD
MMKSPKGILIVLAIVVGSLLLAAPALASTPLNTYEKQLVSLINKERAKRGLRAVRVHEKLVTAAQAHSGQMAQGKFFSHDSVEPQGESFSARIVRYGYQRRGYRSWKAGEDIYYGAMLFSSPVACVDAWMKSPDHRAVILTKDFRDIGVGAIKTDSGFQGVGGTVWIFTMDMGRRSQ